MKRREVASLAMAIVGVTLILQGISRAGLFITEGLSRHDFLIEGMGRLQDVLQQLGPYILFSLLFAIVPGLLAIRYRERVADLVFGADEGEPQVMTDKSGTARTGLGADDVLRLGLTILGAWAIYIGVTDVCGGALGVLLTPFDVQTRGLWVRAGVTPLVMGMVKLAIGYALVFRTSRVVAFVCRVEAGS